MSYPAINVIDKIKLYMDSMGRYGDSPFIYPIYGLGGIPEGFSRISAVNGGTFMLNTDINEIIFENGKVAGVKSNGEVAKCKMVICDPTYVYNAGLKDRVKLTERVLRCICILDHPIPNTNNMPSVQIIIPQKQLGRKNDIYIMMVSSVHSVCKKDYYIAIISTTIETQNPEAEIEVALDMVGPVKEKFLKVNPRNYCRFTTGMSQLRLTLVMGWSSLTVSTQPATSRTRQRTCCSCTRGSPERS